MLRYNVKATINQVWYSYCFAGFLPLFPSYEDGDVIVAAGNIQRKEVVDVNKDLYTYIGYAFVWCIRYIFIPIGVAVVGRIIAHKMLQPQPERQRKKTVK